MTTKHVPAVVPAERVAQAILIIRGRKVILDADLAALYGVPTKRLNEQVKRNAGRFPDDFAFRMASDEVEALNRSQIAIGSRKHRDPRFPPWAFTEHGALAAAFVLNSPTAIEMSVQVVRAFVRLRELLRTNEDLARRVGMLERRAIVTEGDVRKLAAAFERPVPAAEPPASKRRIGFTDSGDRDGGPPKAAARRTRTRAARARR